MLWSCLKFLKSQMMNDGFFVLVNKQNNGKTGYAKDASKAKQTTLSNFKYQPKGTTSTSKGTSNKLKILKILVILLI